MPKLRVLTTLSSIGLVGVGVGLWHFTRPIQETEKPLTASRTPARAALPAPKKISPSTTTVLNAPRIPDSSEANSDNPDLPEIEKEHHLVEPVYLVKPFEKLERRFSNGVLLSSYESPVDEKGQVTTIRMYKTDMKYPIVQVLEKWQEDPNTGDRTLFAKSVMAGDHIMAKAASGASSGDIRNFVAQNGWTMTDINPTSSIFLVTFPAKDTSAIDEVLAVMKSRPDLIAHANPDFVASTP